MVEVEEKNCKSLWYTNGRLSYAISRSVAVLVCHIPEKVQTVALEQSRSLWKVRSAVLPLSHVHP